ncbi:mannose-1-phosphate guanylyltransferase [Qipengyuania marisflavi]|uniref:Mannose-1-phosphate guanylyltransferase n=1 Tax=Qipengyuania marisflavi TaxID=2486356 RepID=A0A5S3P5V6_9SPHN|nr:mannose-1-phosphate guanylyltransferase [Qipengyuania marisflavi]TMM46128.1 mannose-1-phosphate guanylyltransferase [Qipengyuania marisflavi]
MAERIHPVILCGGSGTRLWPRSRKALPKPFLPLLGPLTLFQQGLDRTSDAQLFAPATVVAGKAHVAVIESQLGEAGEAALIVEPAARNTAPAIALAAHRLPSDAVMLVCPSDHYIADQEAFLSGVAKAAALAREGYLVAFGITPTRPETGYGYIECGDALGSGQRVARFVEKPDAERARAFLDSGDFVWNGGIFAFRAGDYLDELARHRPDMAAAVHAAVAAGRAVGQRFHPDAAAFAGITGESIDFAVMENTDRAAVVAADMGWSDIGDWSALMAARGVDDAGNALAGRADITGGSGVMVESDGPRVSVVGLSNIIVVVDGDEVLVTARDAAQDVGKLPGAISQ